jgi:DNA-binding NtrC family response regulator
MEQNSQSGKKFKAKILVIDDSQSFVSGVKATLAEDYEVAGAFSATMAMGILNQQSCNLILLDYEMPQMTGFELLKILKQRHAEIPVVMLTGKSDSDTIIQTMRAGASDFVIKGTEEFEANLKFRISQTLDKVEVVRQNKKLAAKLDSQKRNIEIVGNSHLVLKLKSDILKLKDSSASVFISGENGTGKELIARNINAQENDPTRPFIAINCAALTSTLIESELFGHKRGAFTGAMENKIGKFEAANGGDIFLDEITEIPIELQAKLLRVLQEKVFTPVGSNKEVKLDIRVIAATNRNLDEEVSQGRFREDLFYRLNQFSIYSPSLKERKNDIVTLAEEFLKRKMPEARLSVTATKALLAHTWHGNIRELENTIERAIILVRESKRPIIMPEHLALSAASAKRPTKNSTYIPDTLLPENEIEISETGLQACIDWIERNYFERCLEIFRNNNQAIYARLKMSKAHYFRRKKSLGLSHDQDSESEAGC